MVLVKRRHTVSKVVTTTPARKSASVSSIAYGDGRVSPKNPNQVSPTSCLSPESGTARRFTFSAKSKAPSSSSWTETLPHVLYVVAGLSWLFAYISMQHSNVQLADLRIELREQEQSYNEKLRLVRDSRQSNRALQKRISKLIHTSSMLEHEIRVEEEIDEDGTAKKRSAKKSKVKRTMIVDYMNNRLEALREKEKDLENFIQEDSRQNLVNQFGMGPHHVKVKLQFLQGKKKLDKGNFTMELASEDMPHSVNLFLTQVSNKLWDNADFWDPIGVTHVVSARARLFTNKESRMHHFRHLGVDRVAFQEYSPEWPHNKYTVGFIGKGPEWYISAIDNIYNHGPGGSNHDHLADHHADPCFGRVVEGFDTVDRLVLMKDQQQPATIGKKTESSQITVRIIQVEIL